MRYVPLTCLLALFCGLFASPQASRSAAMRKPAYNVLFIASDDLRPELGCYGNQLVKTPNIDRLASRGVRFERAYAQYPLCNPSRTSLLTGRYPTQTGVMDNETWFRAEHPDFISLPQYFKASGYATLRAGKIFHGGIDDTEAWTEGGERETSRARAVRPIRAMQAAHLAPRNRIASWFWKEKGNRTAITGRPLARLNIWNDTKIARSSWPSASPSRTALPPRRRGSSTFTIRRRFNCRPISLRARPRRPGFLKSPFRDATRISSSGATPPQTKPAR